MIEFLLSSCEWIFDGIGSTIVGSVLGLIIGGVSGGFIGYKICLKNKNKQVQKARDNANQSQVGTINFIQNGDINKDDKRKTSSKGRR